ncbi:hypothetical protein FRB99_002524 [Tulasnella sp. 403]|nr:hypothetical protein FRB99_002524 [Tulasnella sp. 403]
MQPSPKPAIRMNAPHAMSPIDQTPAIGSPAPSNPEAIHLPSSSARITSRASLALATVPPPQIQNGIATVDRIVNSCKAMLNAHPLLPFTNIVIRAVGLLGGLVSTTEADMPPSYDSVVDKEDDVPPPY